MLLRSRVIRIAQAGLGLLVAGCPGFNNTPAQDRVWVVYAVYRSVAPGVHIERVEPNGRYWVWRSSSPCGVG
jgi:hypothetical protein